MVQLNPVPVFGAKKTPLPFERNFLPKISNGKMVSAHYEFLRLIGESG